MDREQALAIVAEAREAGKNPDLHGADLHGADLYGADLYGANLYGADLSGADLYDTRLREAASSYHDAKTALDTARESLHQIIRAAREDGASAYRIAKTVHLSEREVGRIAPPKRA